MEEIRDKFVHPNFSTIHGVHQGKRKKYITSLKYDAKNTLCNYEYSDYLRAAFNDFRISSECANARIKNVAAIMKNTG